nr:hypothetical protein [Tanacetum cinerariifolium]
MLEDSSTKLGFETQECSSCGALYTRDCSCSKGSVEDKILVPLENYARCAKCGHPVNGPYCQGCAIKECSSCGALYTRDFCCSKGNVEDKILVPKPPKNCARYAKCGHPVNGSYCQGCALLREKLEEYLVTYFQNFQNIFESSDDNTNVVNAPREPLVVKQDHGVKSSQNPPHIDECCCECGNALDGIYCQQCICKSCGKGFDQFGDFHAQQYLCCENCGGPHETFQCQPTNEDYYHEQNSCYNSNSFGSDHCQPSQYTVNHPIFDAHNDILTSQTTIMEQMTTLTSMCEMILACCDDDDDYNFAITPVLSTEETVDSLSMGDEHLDTIPAMESDEVIKSSVEDLVPIPTKDHFESVINSNDDISSSDDDSLYKENIEYVEASPHDSELVSLEVAEIVTPKVEEIEDNNLREKLLNIHLLIANIKALKDNPTPSSKLLIKSSSTSPKSFLEETNTFHNSLPEFENFYFNLGEISSGKISSGSITTHSDISLSEYDSFTFDLSNDQCPSTDRSDFTHGEFADELAHIISPPEYDYFYFRDFPDSGELICILNSGIRENPSTTCVNLPVEDDHSPLLAYVVWIFLAYLTYPVIPPYLHSFGNEDTIFDPGITINRVYSFKPGLSHRCGAFKKFNTHHSHLNEWPMIINGKNIPILDVLLFHLYPP